jgi:thioredoxin
MASQDAFTLRCSACKTRNRIPAGRVGAAARCGKCGSHIDTRVLNDGRTHMVGDADFDSQVMASPLPVLAFFWAPWCPTCVQTAPLIDQLAAEARGRLRVAKINVDQAPQVSNRYDIRAVPYIYVFDNGQARENMPGAMDRQQLRQRMARYL